MAIWLTWNHQARIQRILQVTAIPGWSGDAPAVDPASPTGYAQGWRRLILPEHNYRSFQWIGQTQQMLADGHVRVRHLDYENAPHGRMSNLPSPYAWWLGTLATIDRGLTGTPRGLAVERAALYADPLCQLLCVAGAAVLAWARFGLRAVVAVGWASVAWFPLAGNFVSGAPDTDGWLVGLNLLGLIALAAAWQGDTGRVGRMGFAGLCGGLGLWLDAPAQMILPVGLLIGGLAGRLLNRNGGGETVLTATGWRAWGGAAAGVSLLGYLVESAPGHLGWRLEMNHPLYALGWLGVAELLAWLAAPEPVAARRREWLGRGLAAVAVLALPVVWVAGDSLLPWQVRPESGRLSVLNNLGADHLAAWVARDGVNLLLGATLLPGLAAAGLGGWVWRRGQRTTVLLFGGPLLIAAGLAAWQPVWWSLAQVAALPLVVLALPGRAGAGWLTAGLFLAVPGLAVLYQPRAGAEPKSLAESELVGLIARDLAQYLSRQGGGASLTALAPPELTGALHYYAGLSGLGTFAWENRDGLTAAVRIASATSPEEARHLLEQRGITHIVIPAWDRFLDDYAGLGRAGRAVPAAQNSFVAAIHRWEQPNWLRPRAYPIPAIEGFEGQQVEVFEIVEEQDTPGAMSRLAEYFIETGRLDLAGSARQELRRYPAHLGALAATAKVDAARGERAAFAGTVARMQSLLESGGDRRGLPWDRRVSLAVVLATARQPAAQAQLERCVREATAERVRALSPQSLFQLLTLMKRQGMDFPTVELVGLARSLLPPEARGRL